MTPRSSEKKVILITGASSGMGKEAALALIHEGHTVYGAARRVEKMQDLVDAGGHAVQLDVTDHDAVSGVVQRIVQESGRIDVLVNNAGYAIYGAVEDTTIEDARRQFEVNLFGVAALTKAVLPHMRGQRSGKIINITSMGGKIYTPLGAWYHATKHALEGWSDCLRLETKQFGIDVIVVEPGAIATEFGDVMVQPMLDRSGSGPYATMARATAKTTKASYEGGDSSPASVIADVISKAIAARKPKTRYVAGKYAKPMIWMRKWLGDRMFDRLLMSRVNRSR
jgi:NAD(P)-dependent dehydrogenase (short-subunit alcohol dehydrogenase family)